jgi:hypothetical protein
MTETKHMTFDELMKVYDKAASNVAFLQYEGPDHRAGIRAVVEALRDEWFPQSEPPRTITVEERWFLNRLNEILASDGVDKAGTHGSPELDEDARKLEAMGQDAGPTVQDLFPEVFVPAADRIEALEAAVVTLLTSNWLVRLRKWPTPRGTVKSHDQHPRPFTS